MVFAASMPAVAGEVWSWHTVDVSVVKTPGAEVILHGRLRTGNSFGALQQGRVGAVAKLPFPQVGNSADEWQNKHRLFGGLEVPVYGRRGLAADTRGLVERFFVPEGPAFSRYRQRLRLRTAGRLGPYLSTEWFFDASGYLSSRHGAGLRWRCAESATLEFGYLYDARRDRIGEPRHVVVTQFTLDRLWR